MFHRRSMPGQILVLGVLAALGFGLAHAPAEADSEATADAWLEVFIGTLSEGAGGETLTKRVADANAHMASLPGFVRTDAATVPGKPARVLRATVWKDIEAAEAAALAADGEARHRALRSSMATSPSKQYFRQLRSKTYSEAATGHLEVTLYRTRVGTTRAQNLKRFDDAEADFAAGEGILGHSMWLAPNGLWAHVVHWKDEAAFNKTGKGLMRTKGVGGWIRSLDFKRFRVWKGDRLGS